MSNGKARKEVMDRLKKYLKGQMEVKGYSLAEASKAIGISKAHLCDLENGKSVNPNIKTVFSMSRVYGMYPEQILKHYWHIHNGYGPQDKLGEDK